MSIRPFNHKLETFKKEYFKGVLDLSTHLSKMKTYGESDNHYEVPINEIPYWIENGWKFNESENKMERKGRESVNVQQKIF